MGSFLQDIISLKVKEVESIAGEDHNTTRVRDNFLFRRALEKKGLTIIAEFKKASPSNADINCTANLKQYIDLYSQHADAISILTEQNYFLGDINDVYQASKMTKLPILAKDFYIHTSQIIRAANHGASAVLIIARLNDTKEIQRLYQSAVAIGLDAIVEIHSKEDLEKTLELTGPDIIGINTRDLDDFKINPKVLDELLPLIPKKTLVIAESGIKEPEQVKDLVGKVDGVLIGTALMTSPEPDKFLTELKKWSG
ncbi:MAG: indole-3-glycerol-phosphate synthase [Spirochaetes bacterium]|nr:indole-3-glycerol-phosphate synthase [Spirochaetota bacterium]